MATITYHAPDSPFCCEYCEREAHYVSYASKSYVHHCQAHRAEARAKVTAEATCDICGRSLSADNEDGYCDSCFKVGRLVPEVHKFARYHGGMATGRIICKYRSTYYFKCNDGRTFQFDADARKLAFQYVHQTRRL